ncbi:MAG TPA: tRNA (guanosine(46)-N7)-methyltransferase TrmB [Nitrospirae bacterium]|nr:tRNA (guanosine(46)-N7)-methyltransferase TrmB [Nitrospirota bacterium]
MLIRTTSGRRAGRLSSAQKEALQRILPGLDISAPGIVDLRAVFGREAPLHVEVGFGTGEFLYNMARRHGDINFIGIELYLSGVVKLIRRMVDYDNKRRPLPENIRLIIKDTREALKEQFGDESIDCIYILFPDPWPKKRHHKRRLINSEFVSLLKRKLKKGGVAVVATDHIGYAETIEETFIEQGFLKRDCGIPEVYETKYARKALRDGRKIAVFEFVK